MLVPVHFTSSRAFPDHGRTIGIHLPGQKVGKQKAVTAVRLNFERTVNLWGSDLPTNSKCVKIDVRIVAIIFNLMSSPCSFGDTFAIVSLVLSVCFFRSIGKHTMLPSARLYCIVIGSCRTHMTQDVLPFANRSMQWLAG